METKKILDKNGLQYYTTKVLNKIPGVEFVADGGTPEDESTIFWIEPEDIGESSSIVPVDMIDVGTIVPYSGSEAPKNWLICDGRAVSRATYVELFNVIGTTYGTGDGSTTFNLPNLKGKVIIGLDSSDNEFNEIGKTGGEKTHTLTVDEIPSHTHNIYGALTGENKSITNTGNDWGVGTTREWNQSANTNTGGGQPHNNLQPYIVVNYIIKYHREIITNLTSSVEDTLASNSTINALSAKQGKILNETKVSSTNIKNIEMVTEYPSTPDPDTLYVKVATL